jgi:hypothetical protein
LARATPTLRTRNATTTIPVNPLLTPSPLPPLVPNVLPHESARGRHEQGRHQRSQHRKEHFG